MINWSSSCCACFCMNLVEYFYLIYMQSELCQHATKTSCHANSTCKIIVLACIQSPVSDIIKMQHSVSTSVRIMSTCVIIMLIYNLIMSAYMMMMILTCRLFMLTSYMIILACDLLFIHVNNFCKHQRYACYLCVHVACKHLY